MPLPKRLFATLVTCLTAVALLFTVVFTAPQTAQAQMQQDSVVILLDVSGSMDETSSQDATRTKIEVAVDSLTDVVTAIPDSSIELGLRTFSGCSTGSSTLVNNVAVADASHKQDILNSLAGVTADGPTDITNGLTQALTDLPPDGNRTILLVSDDEHNCGEDPCVAVQNIVASGVQIRVNTIGLEVESIFGPSAAELELRCIAAASNGFYQPAESLPELLIAIQVGLSPIVDASTPSACTAPYTLILGACAIFNPGQTIDELLAFECPPAPLDIETIEGGWDGGTFIEVCGYALTCEGLPITVALAAGDSPTSGDDIILGTPGPDVIDAGDGNDVVCSGGGDDVVTGGTGNDTLIGGTGNDVLVGEDGDDLLLGDGGRDTLRGGPGADDLSGGGGNDRLLGGIGDDILDGGVGSDFLGGFGGRDSISGGDGADIIFGGFGADNIEGGNGADEIHGLVGNDLISGGNGDDVITGDRGNDYIEGDGGNDVIKGGNADDVLFGGNGDDTLSGGKADDTLSGDDGIDSCNGNAQNSTDTADSSCESISGIP